MPPMTEAKLKELMAAAATEAAEAAAAKQFDSFQKAHKQSTDILSAMFGGLQPKAPATSPDDARGLKLAQFTLAIAGAHLSLKGGQPESPAAFAKRKFGEDHAVTKALSTVVGADGGFLFGEEVAADFIELLRPASVVRQMNPVVMPMVNGKVVLSGLSGGATFGYIGENKKIAKSQPIFRQVKATAKKGAALVPISNDLIRKPSASAMQVVRDDMVAAAGVGSDAAFIRADGSVDQPKGLRYWAAGANVIPANGTINLANVTSDLNKLILALANANVRMLRPGWLMAPRTAVYLMSVRDTNGNFAFRDEMLAGRLFQYPWKWTTNIPINLGGGTDESEIYLADFADVVIGEEESVLIDVSTDAAYDDGTGTIVSAFQYDQTVVRLLLEHDLVVRHAESIAVLTGVKWTP
jgi:HK97 family phage major capsid protein